jgi:2-keto-4-pentenoate hydratase/2-oxohepta-3-ene-1,7-dioic acid hydratase in catechol pathway
MKIVRYQTDQGPAYAALQPNGKYHAVTGDIFGAYQATDWPVVPGKILAPIAAVNIMGIGTNYRQHAKETGTPIPERPLLFLKSTNTLLAPGDAIEIPVTRASHEVDYEGELAVVIGKKCKNVAKADALNYVLGYMCANDISARDWQKRWGGGQFCQGKGFDTFSPMGPVLVTQDEIPNPNKLRIKTTLNGQTMQDGNSDDMVFDVASLIEFLSGSKTLLPGTVILTGTPAGVGAARKPPVFLKAGDTVTVEIEGIGSLTNPVINERV